MWSDKSPVLLPRHPHPSPDRRDEHVSSVCFALWVAWPQVRRCKTLYIQKIDPVRHGVWLDRHLECLQFTANPVFPVSLHILFKVKGSNEMCVSNCLYDHTHCSLLSGCESGKDVKPNLVTRFRYRGRWMKNYSWITLWFIIQCKVAIADTVIKRYLSSFFRSLTDTELN